MSEQLLTLGEAANVLGISQAAVRMRWKRQKLRGIKKNGRVFVYVVNPTEQAPEQSNERVHEQGEQPVHTDAGDTAVIIEFQRIELKRLVDDKKRLVDDNERLHRRIDNLIETHAKERDREQVLRQQLQNQVDRLTAQIALPPPAKPEIEARLQESEKNLGLLKTGVWQLLRFFEGRRGT